MVIHLAALPLVRPSYADPLATLNINILGTVKILEACRQTLSVRSVVIITSDKCYRNNEWVWGCRENDPMGGHDPYSASKGCAELVTASCIKSFFNQNEYGKKHHVAVASARAEMLSEEETGGWTGSSPTVSRRCIPTKIYIFAILLLCGPGNTRWSVCRVVSCWGRRSMSKAQNMVAVGILHQWIWGTFDLWSVLLNISASSGAMVSILLTLAHSRMRPICCAWIAPRLISILVGAPVIAWRKLFRKRWSGIGRSLKILPLSIYAS